MRLIDADEFEELFENQIHLGNDAYNAAMDALQDAWTMDAEQVRHWIPCSEQMPEPETPVLAVYDDGMMCVLHLDADKELWRGMDVVSPCWAITHWMPLPAPPKGVTA